MNDRVIERVLYLTEEEAMGLLDTILLSPQELSPEQSTAVLKLSDFCRQFLRPANEPVTAVVLPRQPSHAAVVLGA